MLPPVDDLLRVALTLPEVFVGVLVLDAFSDLRLFDLEGVPPPPPPPPPLAPLAGSSVSNRVARLAGFWPSAPFFGSLVLEPPRLRDEPEAPRSEEVLFFRCAAGASTLPRRALALGLADSGAADAFAVSLASLSLPSLRVRFPPDTDAGPGESAPLLRIGCHDTAECVARLRLV